MNEWFVEIFFSLVKALLICRKSRMKHFSRAEVFYVFLLWKVVSKKYKLAILVNKGKRIRVKIDI